MIRDEYERHWSNFTSGSPAPRPLGAHHRENEPCPVFARLCEVARERVLQVGLVASHQLYERGTPSQYRHLRALTLSAGDSVRLRESVSTGWINLRLAAGRLLTTLETA